MKHMKLNDDIIAYLGLSYTEKRQRSDQKAQMLQNAVMLFVFIMHQRRCRLLRRQLCYGRDFLTDPFTPIPDH